MAYIADRLVSICARSNVTFDISLHEVYVRAGVRYVITKLSRMDSLPNFLTHCAPLRALCALRARDLRYDFEVRILSTSRSNMTNMPYRTVDFYRIDA